MFSFNANKNMHFFPERPILSKLSHHVTQNRKHFEFISSGKKVIVV